MKRWKAKQNEKIYQIKVIQSDWQSRLRILALPEGLSLYNIAETIAEAFNFDFDHTFGFYNKIKAGRIQKSVMSYLRTCPKQL